MKKVVLKDIALHLGVSTALVSYVLNNQAEEKQVNKATAEKIRKAAKKLNYLPNHIAKSLKISKTHTIGLVVADINYRYSTGITGAIESEARKNNYTVIYGSSNEDEGKFGELINVFVNRRVDGLILVPVENSQSQIKLLQKADIPFILIDRLFPEIRTNYVALDNHKAAYRATEYLIRSGHKRIAMLNYRTSLYHLQERNRGYRDAMEKYKIKYNNEWLQEISHANTIEDVNSSLKNVMGFTKPCDAVFFATATLALNGLKFMNKNRINVPADISVFSFDESEAFELFYCPITYSRQPLVEMGIRAVHSLIDIMDNHKKINRQLTLDAELITGKSCKEQ